MLVMLTKMGGFEISEHLHRKVVPFKGNAALDFCGRGGGLEDYGSSQYWPVNSLASLRLGVWCLKK